MNDLAARFENRTMTKAEYKDFCKKARKVRSLIRRETISESARNECRVLLRKYAASFNMTPHHFLNVFASSSSEDCIIHNHKMVKIQAKRMYMETKQAYAAALRSAAKYIRSPKFWNTGIK